MTRAPRSLRQTTPPARAMAVVPAAWRGAVLDLEQWLLRARERVERAEAALIGDTGEIAGRLQPLISELEGALLPMWLRTVYDISPAWDALPPPTRSAAVAWARHRLHPLLLPATLLAHAWNWSSARGGTADHAQLHLLHSGRDDGRTAWGRLVNRLASHLPPMAARVRRDQHLAAAMAQLLAREDRQALLAVAVGCGSAQELVELARLSPQCSRLHLVLVDENPAALNWCRARIRRLHSTGVLPPSVRVRTLEAAPDRLGEPRLVPQPGQSADPLGAAADLVYARGLLDRTDDRRARFALRAMVHRVRPGGLVIAAATAPHPSQRMLAELFDWRVHARTTEGLRTLGRSISAMAGPAVRVWAQEEPRELNRFLVMQRR